MMFPNRIALAMLFGFALTIVPVAAGAGYQSIVAQTAASPEPSAEASAAPDSEAGPI